MHLSDGMNEGHTNGGFVEVWEVKSSVPLVSPRYSLSNAKIIHLLNKYNSLVSKMITIQNLVELIHVFLDAF